MFNYLTGLLEKAWADAETKPFEERYSAQQLIEALYYKLPHDDTPTVCTFFYGREYFRPQMSKALTLNGLVPMTPARHMIHIGSSTHVRVTPVTRTIVETCFSELKGRYRESLNPDDLDRYLQNEDISRIRLLSQLYLEADEFTAMSAIVQLEAFFHINAELSVGSTTRGESYGVEAS